MAQAGDQPLAQDREATLREHPEPPGIPRVPHRLALLPQDPPSPEPPQKPRPLLHTHTCRRQSTWHESASAEAPFGVSDAEAFRLGPAQKLDWSADHLLHKVTYQGLIPGLS